MKICAILSFLLLAACAHTKTAQIATHEFAARSGNHVRIPASDPRPKQWCMWWLRRHLGIPRSAFHPYEWNLARAGRYIGRAASGPAIGVIVVWRHHIGIITGRSGSLWVVKSGNDGGKVRERPRTVSAAIAFRWPPVRSFASAQ